MAKALYSILYSRFYYIVLLQGRTLLWTFQPIYPLFCSLNFSLFLSIIKNATVFIFFPPSRRAGSELLVILLESCYTSLFIIFFIRYFLFFMAYPLERFPLRVVVILQESIKKRLFIICMYVLKFSS